MAFGLLSLSALSGCMGPVAKAPFAGRLGSGQVGSLLGPFDGQVLDQSTSSPLTSALVVGTWAFEEPGGLASPESSYSVSVVTGSDGNYSLPSLPAGRQFAGLLRRFTLVVYKAGFVGYRSDLRFDDRSPRHDFVQRGNVVRLERFPQGESHAKHLVFLGSGAALRGAAQSEIIAASLELQETAPQLAAEQTETAAAKESH
ncbi:MAG: carboxypeptidase regulatory-like domain-containing protein [Myxococcales bacterium]|nr:carboxypeptidase regulatory-like domain-containing protein [Myxococcales bacterium]